MTMANEPERPIVRIPTVAEVQAQLDALVVVPHQLPDAPREAHKARMAYLAKKEHLTTLLDRAKTAERNGWKEVPRQQPGGPFGIWQNQARIRGGGPKKTMADWLREYEVCISHMAGLEPHTETWFQKRQRAYMLRKEIKKKAQKLGIPVPYLAEIPREQEAA
jgi:hypothetical protein